MVTACHGADPDPEPDPEPSAAPTVPVPEVVVTGHVAMLVANVVDPDRGLAMVIVE